MITEDILRWDGYLEHHSKTLLGVYTANIGKGGYTVFADMILKRCGRNLQGVPWCAVFVHAVINRIDLLGKPHAGTKVLMRRMKRRGYWRGRTYVPQAGDLLFCGFDKEHRAIRHVGIVLSVKDGDVISIEGNTVDPSGHFAPDEGGAVALRRRRLDEPILFGYGAIGRYYLERNGE